MIAVIKRRAGRWALNGAAAIALAYILTPLTFVTWLAFFRQEIPSFPPEGYSVRWFAAILDQPKFVNGLIMSGQVGILATFIGLALGVPAALGVSRYRFAFRAPISSLLLTYIAIALMNHFVEGPLRDPSSLNKPSTFPIGDANMIGNIPGTSVHWGLVVAVALASVSWVLMRRTTFGFAARLTGGNVRAAR